MKSQPKRKQNPAVLNKRDFLLAGAVLAAAVLCFLLLPRGAAATAVVERGGEELYRIPLFGVTSPYELTIDGEYPAVLLIEKDGVSFLSAACPDKLCVRTGKLTQAGQTAVCLPARLTLRLLGGPSSVDGYTG